MKMRYIRLAAGAEAFDEVLLDVTVAALEVILDVAESAATAVASCGLQTTQNICNSPQTLQSVNYEK